MVELEAQIKAWADATAPPVDESVTAADVIHGGGSVAGTRHGGAGAGPRRGRWLLVAAVVALLGAIAIGLVVQTGDGGPETVRAGDPDGVTTSSMIATTTVPTPAEEVRFETIARAPGNEDPGTLRSAQTKGEVAELWSGADQDPPAPGIDLDRDVLVSISVWGRSCAELSGFARSGRSIEPRFTDLQDSGCEDYLGSKTYVVAIEWGSVGDDFVLEIPAHESPYPEVPEVGYAARQVSVKRIIEPQVVTTLELDSTEIPAGGEIGGTLTIENRTGAPIEGETCGDPIPGRLERDVYKPLLAGTTCTTPISIPEGTSTFPVVVGGDYLSCLPPGVRPGGDPYCEADGTPPPLPVATYQLTVPVLAGISPPDPVMVTVT